MVTTQLKTARVARYHRYGPSEVLEIHRAPLSSPGEGQVLVRVHAAGLNPKDALIRSGALRLQTGRAFPRGTGFDLAGEVVATGPGVSDQPVGARVWGFLDGVMGGSAGDFVVVPRSCLGAVPSTLGWTEAAALPLAGSAALQALRDVACVRPGERVLIRGASGGVGSAAIQIARAWGARVTALTRASNVEHCRALGAHEVVVASSAPGGRFDVFLDCVGGSSLRRYGRLLGAGGRWVTVALSLPVFAMTPVTRILSPMLRLPRLGFVVVRPRTADLDELERLVDSGALRMPIAATYPLERIREAHDDVAAGRARGKRVLTISPEALREAQDRHETSAAAEALEVA